MAEFIPGMELSRRYYHEIVRPLLDSSRFSHIPFAAAHLGPGSDVLGFDTDMSTDHDWGPSVHIFIREKDSKLSQDISQTLYAALPETFYGYHVNPQRLFITTTRSFYWNRLSYDITTPLDPVDWLTFPSQRLREVVSGVIHEDRSGELTLLRERFSYYPHDIWLYLMAATWQRIGQEEHLVLRAGYVGDELGSSIIGSRLVRDLMNLCFLLEREYAPYAKWFGTAFQQLQCSPALGPIFKRVQLADTWKLREEALCESYLKIAHLHNSLSITEKVSATVSNFYDRPFRVIYGARFSEAILREIRDPEVKRIVSRPFIGGIDQFSDNTDMKERHVSPIDSTTSWRHILKRLYTE